MSTLCAPGLSLSVLKSLVTVPCRVQDSGHNVDSDIVSGTDGQSFLLQEHSGQNLCSLSVPASSLGPVRIFPGGENMDTKEALELKGRLGSCGGQRQGILMRSVASAPCPFRWRSQCVACHMNHYLGRHGALLGLLGAYLVADGSLHGSDTRIGTPAGMDIYGTTAM